MKVRVNVFVFVESFFRENITEVGKSYSFVEVDVSLLSEVI